MIIIIDESLSDSRDREREREFSEDGGFYAPHSLWKHRAVRVDDKKIRMLCDR